VDYRKENIAENLAIYGYNGYTCVNGKYIFQHL